jgi:hypothetical protein
MGRTFRAGLAAGTILASLMSSSALAEVTPAPGGRTVVLGHGASWAPACPGGLIVSDIEAYALVRDSSDHSTGSHLNRLPQIADGAGWHFVRGDHRVLWRDGRFINTGRAVVLVRAWCG